jgi:hypothetical protein
MLRPKFLCRQVAKTADTLACEVIVSTGFTKRVQLSPAVEAAIQIAILILIQTPYFLRHLFIDPLSLSDIAFWLALTVICGLLIYLRYSHRRGQQKREEHIKEMIDEEIIRRIK